MAFLCSGITEKPELSLQENQVVTFGRGDEANIKINDKRCSRIQAELTYFLDSANRRGRALLKAVVSSTS